MVNQLHPLIMVTSWRGNFYRAHYGDVIMGRIASQITSLTIVYSTIYSDADQRKHQSSGSLAFVRGIHWGPVNSPHKWPVTRKMFPFHDVIMYWPFMRWIHRSPVGSLHEGPAARRIDVSLMYTWTNSWTTSGFVGDLRLHDGVCDVTA